MVTAIQEHGWVQATMESGAESENPWSLSKVLDILKYWVRQRKDNQGQPTAIKGEEGQPKDNKGTTGRYQRERGRQPKDK